MKSLGIIGAGSMGSSIIRGALDAGYIRQNQLTVFPVKGQSFNFSLAHNVVEGSLQNDRAVCASFPYLCAVEMIRFMIIRIAVIRA